MANIDAAVAAARAAFDDPTGWSPWTPERRAAALLRFADEHEARGSEIGLHVTMQNGMPTSRSAAWEGGYPPVMLRYFAQMPTDQEEERRPGFFGGAAVVRLAVHLRIH